MSICYKALRRRLLANFGLGAIEQSRNVAAVSPDDINATR